MPAVVTFDPINLRIVEISTGGDNTTNIEEIYLEWKDWQLLTPQNMGFPPAFDYIGLQDTEPGQQADATFFLLNRWKLRPAELNHNWILNGNLFSALPSGEAVVVPTLGSFQVLTSQVRSNIVTLSKLEDQELSLKLELNNLITSKITGIMTLYDDDKVTEIATWQLWEDFIGGQTYRGLGAQVRERLT